MSEFSHLIFYNPNWPLNLSRVPAGPLCSWVGSEWDEGVFGSSLFNSKASVILKCISHRALTENSEEVPGGEEGSGVILRLGRDGAS